MQEQDQVILDSLKDTMRELESYIREEYCTSCDDFLENDILKRAAAMCLISADQLIADFSDHFITAHQQINFARFTTVRYIAQRNYRSLDFYVLWSIATKELPAFLEELFAAAGIETNSKRLGQAQMQEHAQLRPQMSHPAYEAPLTSQAPPRMQEQKPVKIQDQALTSDQKSQEARQPFVMNELYKRQAYNQMMQKNMSKEEAAVETKKEVNSLLEMLEKEKRSRGL